MTPGHKINGFGNVSGMGRGIVKLICKIGSETNIVTLKDVVHAPSAPFNLVSVSRMTDAKFNVMFKGGLLHAYAPGSNKEVIQATKVGGLYNIEASVAYPNSDIVLVARTWEE